MSKSYFWLSILGILISFAGGFLLANALNRNELNSLRGENERLKNTSPQTASSLSNEEIRQKIAEADQNPNNLPFQKNLGMALYRYAAFKQETDLLTETIRLLDRAYENDPTDYDVLVTLGNAHFDIGFIEKNNSEFLKAREFYLKALEQKPDDTDVRTDLGLTYYLTEPREMEKALNEFKKSLQVNERNEKTLQVLAQAFISEKNAAEAEKYITKLKEVNKNNPALPQIETDFAQLKNNP
jgi:tetratricopeptide (TPR) repeat protein